MIWIYMVAGACVLCYTLALIWSVWFVMKSVYRDGYKAGRGFVPEKFPKSEVKIKRRTR